MKHTYDKNKRQFIFESDKPISLFDIKDFLHSPEINYCWDCFIVYSNYGKVVIQLDTKENNYKELAKTIIDMQLECSEHCTLPCGYYLDEEGKLHFSLKYSNREDIVILNEQAIPILIKSLKKGHVYNLFEGETLMI